MNFYNIAFKNIRRNFKNYKLYIFSTTFIITIYYVFNAIAYNPQVILEAKNSAKYNTGLVSTGVVIAVISAVFIWYSSSFFIRSRKKELGMYSLFGIRKSQINLMIFIENIIIAVMSIAIGILAGILLSRLFTMLIFKLMRNIETVKFLVPFEAVRSTVFIFIGLFLLASVLSSIQISRLKLIDLFSAHKKREKEPKSNIILTVLSIALIVFGYWLSQHMFMNSLFGNNIFVSALVILTTVILGTFGLFSFAVIFITKLAKKNKKSYYKDKNLISISNLSYRIKSQARTLAIITVLSGSAMTAMGVVYCSYYDQIVQFQAKQPFSYNLFEIDDDNTENEILSIINKYDKHKITGKIKNKIVTVEGSIDSKEENNIISQFFSNKMDVNVISESQYNDIMKARNKDNKLNLNSNECFLQSYIAMNFTLTGDIEDLVMNIDLKDEVKQLNIVGTDTNVAIEQNFEYMMIVVDDELFSNLELKDFNKTEVLSININKTLDSKELSEELEQYSIKKGINCFSYYSDYIGSSKQQGVILFSTFFAGIVFLITTGCVIYFKMITEAKNDKEKYDILRKIGFRDIVIKKAIRKQVFIMFMLPLLLGTVHALFALSTFSQLFSTDLRIPIIINVVIYCSIYFIYYLLTVNYYNRICLKSKYARVMQ